MNRMAIFLFFLFDAIYFVSTYSLKINYFKEVQNLYYIKCLNNNNSFLYFEYWGEQNNIRYFTRIKIETGEEIYFGNEKIKRIDTSYSTYHTSIIINNNNEDNVFSINVNKNYFEFINLNNGEYTYKKTDDIFDIDTLNKPSYRNSLIKLKNNNYLLSVILYKDDWVDHYNVYLAHFNFTENTMNKYNMIKKTDPEYGYINITSCFQTENQYIECSYNHLYSANDYFLVGIYDMNLKRQDDIEISEVDPNVFMKIFHIKKEIGAYIYFDKSNKPNIQIKKINNDHNNLENIFDFKSIILNADGKYTLNSGLFYSDGIKINDDKFIIILTTQDLLNLLICVFDLYNNDKSLRLKYFYLPLNENNIKISINIQAFNFGNLLGISFYNFNTKYLGYTIFNIPNFKKDNNYMNNTLTKIELFKDSPSNIFSLNDNIDLLNNILGEEMIRIKISYFKDISSSGVMLKSSVLNREININDELELNDKIIFEPSKKGAFPNEYYLNFSTILKEQNNEQFLVLTQYYGQDTNYQSKEIIGKKLIIVYKVECYEKCITCTQLGSESNYFCVQCNDDFPYNVNNGEKYDNICSKFIYIKENIKYCIENYNSNQSIYKKSENEKYCLDNCNENQFNYIDIDNTKYCLDICNNTHFIYEGDEKYCLKNCNDNQFKYIKNENEKYCLNICNKDQFVYIEKEDDRYCKDECNNIYLFLYIKNENEKFCLFTCDNDLFINIENDGKQYCVNECNINQYIFINNSEKYCISNCYNNHFKYIKNEKEKYCLSSCIFNNEELFLDEEYKICYNNCSESNSSKIFSYQQKCIAQCPDDYIPYNNTCILDGGIYESSIKSLIKIYNEDNSISQLNIQSEEENINNTIIICYSVNDDLNELVKSYPNLIFINLKECLNLLMEQYKFDNISEYLIIEIFSFNDSNNYIPNNFSFEIYTRKGEKISNLSLICENAYIDLSSPIYKQ